MTTPTVVRLLSTADAAAMVDFDARKMRRLLRQGLIPGAKKIGALYYVSEACLRAWIGDTALPNATPTISTANRS